MAGMGVSRCWKVLTTVVLVLVPLLGTLAAAATERAKLTVPSVPAPFVPGPLDGPLPWSDPARFNKLFAPFTTEHASLSPDGKHLAFSLLQEGKLYVAVMEIDKPDRLTAKILINSRSNATPRSGPLLGPKPEFVPRVNWMAWVSSTRVVASTRMAEQGEVVVGFDATGENLRVLATDAMGRFLSRFDIYSRSTEADCILLRVNFPMTGGRRSEKAMEILKEKHTYSDFLRLNTVTGKFTEMKVSEAVAEARKVRELLRVNSKYEKRAHSRDITGLTPGSRGVEDLRMGLMDEETEAEFRAILPGKRVILIETDQVSDRCLALVEGMVDPGSFYILDRKRRVAVDLVRRVQGFESAQAPVTTLFEFTTEDGQKASGEITMPRTTKLRHTPVVVLLPDDGGRRTEEHERVEGALVVPASILKGNRGFSAPAAAFVEMGLAVVRIDFSVPEVRYGEWQSDGGRNFVEQVLRVVDGLGGLHPVSKRRIVLFGEDSGGTTALRGLQILPERFTAAVVISPRYPLIDLSKGEIGISRPFLGFYRESMFGPQKPSELQRIVKDVRKSGVDAESLPYDSRLGGAGKAAIFREIERFVNTTIYDFVVKIGEAEVLPD